MFIQIVPLILSVLLGLFITPNMVYLSTSAKTRFIPDGDTSVDGRGIPLSGISFFLIVVISLCISMALPYFFELDCVDEGFGTHLTSLFQLLVGSALLFLVGLKDDLSGAGDFVKFASFLLAALLFPGVGLWINDLHGLFGLHQIPAVVGQPLTVLFVMYITFAFSLLDGIDGLNCGFGCLALLAFYLLSFVYGSPWDCAIPAAALGVTAVISVMTLLRYRHHRSMMGNSGSYVLGYIVACLALNLSHGPSANADSMMISVGILILPMLDVLRVLGSRIRDGRNIETPDRNQFNYKLLRTGIALRWVPLWIVLLFSMFVLLNLIGIYLHSNNTLLLFINVGLWVSLEYFLNWRIHAFEQAHHKAEWNKLYGKDAWNSHIPHEVMRHKIETYGTMGLPSHLQSGNPIEFIPDGMTGFGRSTKRLWDLFLSFCCLIAFSPLFLICYIMIKMDDGGPAIYKQERIGRFGRPFFIYKFRSMRLDAEKNGPALSHANGEEDPRLTVVGKFLREHHLDELPQLWNVFLGDMAFIGYRPERKFFIDQIMLEDPRYAFLYQIRPGVTSYATLYNGYTDTMAKMLRRLELDLYYLRHRSWWFDCKVLFLTFTSIVFGKKF